MAKPLALTSGEPAGIGPDITLKAWLRRDELNLPAFYWLGDAASLQRRANQLGLNIKIAEMRPEEAGDVFAEALPVVPTGHAATARPGHPDDSSAGAVVTNPIAKNVLYRAGFRHPGHTEYLAELAATNNSTPQPVMMLWSPTLAVVPVTIHVSVREALAQLSSELIVTTARIVVAGLKSHFDIARPRLAVSGLNPHAGEDGSLGTEEQTIVAPAVDMLRKE